MHTTLSFAEPDIAVLTLDTPNKKANVLSQPVLAEIATRLDEVAAHKGLAGLIIRSGKPGSFIAGADINEFAAAQDIPPEQSVEIANRGRRLFQRLSQLPLVTVAAIDGICVGGGAELAIWCDRRIMSSDRKAQFGFPEVKLGLIPGWGGTARAPRIIGLGNAVELISGGETIDGRAAAAMGLVTDVVPADRIQQAALDLIRAEQASGDYLRDRERWGGPIDINETELTYLGATGSAYIQQQTKGQYPAPTTALEVMLGAAGSDIEAACQQEAEAMAGLFGTPINRALINVFLITDRAKKDPGVEAANIEPRPVKSVGVFGAGIMGSGIAAAAVKRELPLTITDAAVAMLPKAVAGILEEVSYNKAIGGPDAAKSLQFAGLINATTVDAAFLGCDLIIEAVVENPDVKQKLFARIEPQLRPETILATNTSTIPIGRLAEGLQRPERFCGIHFFNPVRRMPLVEVIRGPKTNDQTVVTAVAYAKFVGKTPIVVNDGPGFLVNRLLLPYMNEALELLLSGAEIKAVDRAARNFGMPMGPIALYDVVGIDTAYYAGQVMQQAFADRCPQSPLLEAMVKAGRLGQKTGVGFFTYKGTKKGRGEPDPTLATVVQPLVREQQKFTEAQITARLFLPMVVEATRILEEQVVRDPRDVDLGLIYGCGFPPFKGGLLFWADTVGAKQIVEQLEPLMPLGKKFEPTPMLRDMARSGQKFYQRG